MADPRLAAIDHAQMILRDAAVAAGISGPSFAGACLFLFLANGVGAGLSDAQIAETFALALGMVRDIVKEQGAGALGLLREIEPRGGVS